MEEVSELLSQLFLQRTDASFISDHTDYTILHANPAFYQLYGIKPQKTDSLKETDLHILPERIVKKIYQEAKEKSIQQFEFIHRKKDGNEIIISQESDFFVWKGRPLMFARIKETNSDQRDRVFPGEARYREIVENLPILYCEYDRNQRIQFLNKTGILLTGYTEEDLKKGLYLADHVIETESLARNVKLAFQDKRQELQHYSIITKSNKILHLMVMAHPIIEGNEIVRIRVVGIDVTSNMEMREQLKKSEEKFRQFAQLLPETVFEIDLEGNFLFLNEFSYKAFGYSKKEKLNAFQMYIPSEIPRIKKNMELLIQGDESRGHEYVAKRKDGSLFPVLQYSLVTYEDTRPVGFRGIIIDITSRKKAEQALFESEEKYRSLTNQLPVGVYRTTQDGRFLYANRAFLEIFGYQNMEELFSIPVQNLYYDKDFRQIQLSLTRNKPGQHQAEFQVIRKDGTITWIRDTYNTFCDPEGKLLYYDGIIEDISQNRLLEEKLKQSERLQAIGTLASGIAHDFNNLLMGMQLYLEIALKSEGLNAALRNNLEKALSGQIRAKQLIQQILSFSNQDEVEPEMIDIAHSVQETIELIKPTIPPEINLNIQVQQCGSIYMSPLHIHQILTNLITNSIHAMEGAGSLIIKLFPIGPQHDVHKQSELKNGIQYFCIFVEDTGCGMDAFTREHIFDPFYTTKKTGMGTGLGMSIVHGIVSKYKGDIVLNTEQGKGTAISILIPQQI